MLDRKNGLKMIKFLSNVPSLLKHKPEIEVLLHHNNIDILALNETKLDPNILKCHTDIDGYHHERFDRNRHGGGACVSITILLTTKYTLTLQIMSWKPFVLK